MFLKLFGYLFGIGTAALFAVVAGAYLYAADLEAVLQGHPAVAECAVVAVPSLEWGETPLAVVVAREGARETGEQIREWANARLGKTQRLSAVELTAELPRSEVAVGVDEHVFFLTNARACSPM